MFALILIILISYLGLFALKLLCCYIFRPEDRDDMFLFHSTKDIIYHIVFWPKYIFEKRKRFGGYFYDKTVRRKILE